MHPGELRGIWKVLLSPQGWKINCYCTSGRGPEKGQYQGHAKHFSTFFFGKFLQELHISSIQKKMNLPEFQYNIYIPFKDPDLTGLNKQPIPHSLHCTLWHKSQGNALGRAFL